MICQVCRELTRFRVTFDWELSITPMDPFSMSLWPWCFRVYKHWHRCPPPPPRWSECKKVQGIVLSRITYVQKKKKKKSFWYTNFRKSVSLSWKSTPVPSQTSPPPPPLTRSWLYPTVYKTDEEDNLWKHNLLYREHSAIEDNPLRLYYLQFPITLLNFIEFPTANKDISFEVKSMSHVFLFIAFHWNTLFSLFLRGGGGC